MVLVYEAEITETGKLHLDVENALFTKGQRFTVEIKPEPKPALTEAQQGLAELRRLFQARDPFKGMTEAEILAELRRQREEIVAQYPTENELLVDLIKFRQEMGYVAP